MEWDPETVQDAIVALESVDQWELVPERWEHVAGIIQRIGEAYAAGDEWELRESTADLQLYGPIRILRIGSAHPGGVPDQVLERRNTLVHALVREQRTEREPESDRGRQSPR